MSLVIGPTIVGQPGLYGLGELSGAPVSGHITSPFGPRQPIWTPAGWTSDFHAALDINGPGIGGRPVLAGIDQQVTAEGMSMNGYGNAVFAVCNTGHQFLYAHLKPGAHAGKGNFVPRGGVIGQVGTTGASTGDHLHFGVLQPGLPTITDVNIWLPRDVWVDPMQFFSDLLSPPPPEPVLAGVPPGPGQWAMMSTIRECTVAEALAQLDGEKSLHMLIDGVWFPYIVGAPAGVNAGFPDPIPASTAVLVIA